MSEVRQKVENCLSNGLSGLQDVDYVLKKLRDIITESRGLDEENEDEIEVLSGGEGGDLCTTLRGRLWKSFLRVESMDSEAYVALSKKRCSAKEEVNIANDVFRTFAGDESFKIRVSQDKLKRVLRILLTSLEMNYLQGMNVIAGIFLYAMPELDAFYSLRRLFTVFCPTYVGHKYVGVYAGCLLVSRIIHSVDEELYKKISSSGDPKIFFFSAICSFSADTRPLTEAVRLFDFFSAYGFHLNVVAVAIRVLFLKDKVMNEDRPNIKKLLQDTPLKAEFIIPKVLETIPKLPSDLFKIIIEHILEVDVCKVLESDVNKT